ncbi:unnamed protein product, partial [marine sediment metagenome]
GLLLLARSTSLFLEGIIMPEDTEEEVKIEVSEEEAAMRPCSILEYRWASTYSDDKVFEFGKRNLISADCASIILDEREKQRAKSP